MAIKRMNHAVLYVRSVERTFAFYRDVLGFRVVMEMPGAKFLQAPDSTNDHDLGIFEIGMAAGASTAGRATVGLYHIAWEVQTLSDLRDIATKLTDADALVGATDHGTTKALYGKDPDGLEFEVCWLVPEPLPHRRRHRSEVADARTGHRVRHRALRPGDGRRRLTTSSPRACRAGRRGAAGRPGR